MPEKLILIQNRIDACDLLIDYVLDDVPNARQQPILDELQKLRGDLDGELIDFGMEMKP